MSLHDQGEIKVGARARVNNTLTIGLFAVLLLLPSIGQMLSHRDVE